MSDPNEGDGKTRGCHALLLKKLLNLAPRVLDIFRRSKIEIL